MAQVNYQDWVGFLTFKRTVLEMLLEKVKQHTVALFTGNRAGKTATIMHYVVKVIAGVLPHEEFNLRPNNPYRTIRLASETLPTDPEGGEARNTMYPALKRVLPPSWIKKDITIRKPIMTLKDPQGGPDVYIEFVSYNQAVQSQAGVDRFLIICDECPPAAFWDEQKPRLLNSNGRIMIGLTSIDANWTYEEIYERAKAYARTPAVRAAFKKYLNQDVKAVEKTDSTEDICVIQASTDDNPTIEELIKEKKLNCTLDEYISRFITFEDPDMLLMRRYGIFKQITGAIFKDFQWDIHFISASRYFPSGIPHEWRHGRMIDYHEENPWAGRWLVNSFDNEAFVWQEMSPSPSNNTILAIAQEIIGKTGDYKSYVDLMDPLGAKNQPSVSISAMQDMNRKFSELKRQGCGTGGYWQSWDTKSTKGRDAVKERLKNARLCGKPFNNKVVRNGKTEILPTLWILDNCRQTALSLKNWRLGEHKDANARVEKDPKETPQQKWSHFCMCLEAAFKHVAFQHSPRREAMHEHDVPQAHYGQGGRR